MAARRKPINGEGHRSLAGIDRLVLDHLAERKIPGATVAVGIGSRLVYNKGIGYANGMAKVPMLPTHRTWSGSTSKMLTTAAVMNLHESPGSFTISTKMYAPGGLYDRVDFRDAIEAAISSFGASQADVIRNWYHSIRVSHLLSHCGGFSGQGNTDKAAAHFGVDREDVTTRHNHLWFLRHRPLAIRPGMRYEYSNRSIGVMDHVIETLSGVGYKDYVRSQVLEPLGLNRVASIDQPRDVWDATPHAYVGEDRVVRPVALEAKPGTGASGGWRTTASDLVRFMMALDDLSSGRQILSPTTRKLMEKPPYPLTNGGRGLGWGVAQKGPGAWLRHSGSAPSGGASYMSRFSRGYVAGNGADLTNMTVAVTFNIQNSGGASSLVARIARLAGAAPVRRFYDLLDEPTRAAG